MIIIVSQQVNRTEKRKQYLLNEIGKGEEAIKDPQITKEGRKYWGRLVDDYKKEHKDSM